jgi:hypothetical protein
MRIEVEKVGQLAIAATAQLERFQAGIEAALLLIEQTVEQEDGGFHFPGGNLQQGRIHPGGQELHGTACQELASLDGWVHGHIEVSAGNDLAGNSPLLGQLMQRILLFDV